MESLENQIQFLLDGSVSIDTGSFTFTNSNTCNFIISNSPRYSNMEYGLRKFKSKIDTKSELQNINQIRYYGFGRLQKIRNQVKDVTFSLQLGLSDTEKEQLRYIISELDNLIQRKTERYELLKSKINAIHNTKGNRKNKSKTSSREE